MSLLVVAAAAGYLASRAGGAIAAKFPAAYTRRIEFAVVDRAVAADLYRKAAAGIALTSVEAKALGDHLFGDICARAAVLRDGAIFQ